MSIRGRNQAVTIADTDALVITMPASKEMLITRALFSNNNPAATRVRVFDTFTERDGTVHSSTVNPIPIFDLNLQPGETAIETSELMGVLTAVGDLVAQATVAGVFPDDVTVGLFGRFE